MIEHGSKKSESIEVRLSHGEKQAFMSKASFEGRTVSEVVRHSIASYLSDERQRRSGSIWKHSAAFAVAGITLLFAFSISSPAAADRHREFEALKARAAYDRTTDKVERERLAKEFAKEFASQRIVLSAPDRQAIHIAFTDLDFDSDGRLSLTEYRHLIGVPDGDAGRRLFEAHDRSHDRWLSEQEFSL